MPGQEHRSLGSLFRTEPSGREQEGTAVLRRLGILRGTERIPVLGGWEVGGNHCICFSCWSKIMPCPGPEPHAPGGTAARLCPLPRPSTASPSARRFLPWELRARFPRQSLPPLKTSVLFSPDPDSGSGESGETAHFSGRVASVVPGAQ